MKKPKSKIGECEYHLCRKRTKVFLCKYCGRYFCKDHIKPQPVLNFQQVSTAKEPLRSKLEKIWRSERGHPDYAYTPIFWKKIEEEEKIKTERMWEVLDSFKELKEVEYKEKNKPELESFESPSSFTYTLKDTKKSKNMLRGVFILIFITILFWFLLENLKTQNLSQKIAAPIIINIEDICLSQVNENLEIVKSKSPSQTKFNVINVKKFTGGENITEWVEIYFLSPIWGSLSCESSWAEFYLPCKDYEKLKNLSGNLSSKEIVGVGVAIKKEAVELGTYYSAVFPVFCDSNGNLLPNSKKFLLTTR